MNRREVAMWLFIVAALCATVLIVRRPISGAPAAARPTGVRPVAGRFEERPIIVAANPFRIDRRPAALPFTFAAQAGPRAAESAAPPKPSLTLRGIAGGPPWHALVDGFPGRNAAVLVRAGAHVGDLLVTSISRDTVVVRGMDTTWRLTLVRAWR